MKNIAWCQEEMGDLLVKDGSVTYTSPVSCTAMCSPSSSYFTATGPDGATDFSRSISEGDTAANHSATFQRADGSQYTKAAADFIGSRPIRRPW